MSRLPLAALATCLLLAGCGRPTEDAKPAQTQPESTASALIDMQPYQPQNIQRSTAASALDDQYSDQSLAQILQASADEFGNLEIRRNEQRIMEAFAKTKCPGLNYPGDVSLAEVLSFLEAWLTDESGFDVAIRPDVTDADIESESYFEQVTVSNIRIAADSMTVRSAVENILSQIKDNELTWIVGNETILITTVATMESEGNLFLRSYDVSALKSLGFDQGGVLTSVMELSAPPALWIQNGDDIGSMVIAGNHLIVRQTRSGHEAVTEIIERLKLAAKAHPTGPAATDSGGQDEAPRESGRGVGLFSLPAEQ
jgi:hypothetical protein